MRSFWMKTVNILVIVFILFIYQVNARSSARMNKVISEVKASVEQAEQNSSGDPEDGVPSIRAYRNGRYEGSGTGYKGELRVVVTIEDSRISSVDIVESADDKAYLRLAAGLTEDIIARQTTEGINTVSGATFSSKGLIEAVSEALKGAAG